MNIAGDVVASIAWDILGDEATIKKGDKVVLASSCFLDTDKGSIAVVPTIDLSLRPELLQARIIVTKGVTLAVVPPPMVWVSVDLGRHEDHFGEDACIVLDVLERPALRVVFRCRDYELSGIATQPLVLRPKANLAKGETEWIADDLFPDVREGVLAVLAAYGEEIGGVDI